MMYIEKISIKNFRLLKDTTLNLRDKMSLLIGRNNTGKTSFIVLLEKFFGQAPFFYDDYPISLRPKLKAFNENTDVEDLKFQLIFEIRYSDADNLESLSELILDLDPDMDVVKILFECSIDKKSLIKALQNTGGLNKEAYIKKNISRFLIKDVFAFSNDTDLDKGNRDRLIKKKIEAVKSVINLQIIHAKRNVSSSEDNPTGKKPLSNLSTDYFNQNNAISSKEVEQINEQMIEIDKGLDQSYEEFFKGFLSNAKKFLRLQNLKVISDIQSSILLENTSRVIYGGDNDHLPEHLNGLGFMNILFLLLSIEIKKAIFLKENKDINLLIIEEPEAHTHPQMQYVFANEIQVALKDVASLQTIITTHSPHIVSQWDFHDIRYLLANEKEQNVQIKNFYDEMKKRYTDKEQFKFVNQYLNIQSSELFFASKVIFIEGISEGITLPLFISQFDDSKSKDDQDYLPLSSQNISIMEVGANAKVFQHFLELLNIKTLIITDIDSTKKTKKKKKDGTETTVYEESKVSDSDHTSNATLTHFLKAPEITDAGYPAWYQKLKKHSLHDASSYIRIAYQSEENKYHARSFEDAFISANLSMLIKLKDEWWGVKNPDQIEEITDIYDLTETILGKKSDFASYILFKSLSKEQTAWIIPSYIKEGLEWLVA